MNASAVATDLTKIKDSKISDTDPTSVALSFCLLYKKSNQKQVISLFTITNSNFRMNIIVLFSYFYLQNNCG